MALAQFTPLHLKVLETYKIEQVKASGVTDTLSHDARLESRLPPASQLHPAERVTIYPASAMTQEEADAEGSPTNIFTDGSKLDSGVTGCAFVVHHADGRRESQQFRLDSCCSVFQAELLAIDKALDWCRASAATPVSLYSDSQSAIAAIRDRSNPHPLVVSIHDSLCLLQDAGVDVHFVWVKAHVGIAGNEEADAAAKDATDARRPLEYGSFPLSYAKRVIKQETRDAWQQEYADALQGSTTKSFFPSLDSIRLLRASAESSFEMTQFLTGHGFHRSYLVRFHIMDDARCPCDWESVQDVDHLLHSCTEYATPRASYHRLCRDAGVSPWDWASVVQQTPLVEGLRSFVTAVVKSLKDFNTQTPPPATPGVADADDSAASAATEEGLLTSWRQPGPQTPPSTDSALDA